jgi:hypothetical protein
VLRAKAGKIRGPTRGASWGAPAPTLRAAHELEPDEAEFRASDERQSSGE